MAAPTDRAEKPWQASEELVGHFLRQLSTWM